MYIYLLPGANYLYIYRFTVVIQDETHTHSCALGRRRVEFYKGTDRYCCSYCVFFEHYMYGHYGHGCCIIMYMCIYYC